jgi:hypothetical protein
MTDVPQLHPWFHIPGFIAALAVFLLVPLVYLLFFVRRWDEEEDLPEQPWDRLMVLWFVGLALFFGVVTAPTWARLCVVSVPAFIIFVWYFTFAGRLQRIRIAGLWVLALALAVGVTIQSKLQWRGYATTPIGKIAVFDHTRFEEINYLLARTQPEDYVFSNGTLGFLLDLRDPARVAYVTASNYTRPEQVSDLVDGLKKYPVKYILWSTILAVPRSSDSGNHLLPLFNYLMTHYHVVKSFPNFDVVWEKGPQPAPAPPPVEPPTTPQAPNYTPIPLP